MAFALLATSVASISFADHELPPFDATDAVPDYTLIAGGDPLDYADYTPDDVDACNSATDDQSKNGADYKLNSIEDTPPPVFQLNPMTPKSDICNVWLSAEADSHGDIWLYFAWTRYANTGSQLVYLELLTSLPTDDEDCDTVTDFGCNPFANRDAGSEVLVYDFQGTDADINVLKRTWNPTGGDGTGAFGPEGPAGSNVDGHTSEDGYFGEAAINLTAEGILPNVNDATDCTVIAAAIPYSVTGNADDDTEQPSDEPSVEPSVEPSEEDPTKADTAEMKDVVLFDIDPISNCGSITLEKRDSDDELLAGATMALYEVPLAMRAMDNTAFNAAMVVIAGADGVVSDSELTTALFVQEESDCTETSCTYSGLNPGTNRWLGAELDAPDGYELSSPNWQRTTLLGQGSVTLTFVNPRIAYWIQVTPDGVNPVGQTHTFLVQAFANWSCDDEDPPNCSGDPLPSGMEIDLAWLGLTEGETPVGAITAVDDLDDDADLDSCAPTTIEWGEDTYESACLVTVNSSDPGSGKLTASLTLPYSAAAIEAEAEPVQTTNWNGEEGDLVPSIWDAATKAWKQYRVVMSDDDINLTGESHDFLVRAEYADADLEGGDPDWQPYSGASITFGWTGPGDPSPNPCITADDVSYGGSEYDGACVVTVSSDVVDSGVLSVTSFVAAVGDPIELDESREVTLSSSDTATKTWIEVNVDIDDPAVNMVGDDHEFDVTATITTPSGTVDMPIGSELSYTLGGDLAATASVSDDCDPFVAAGTCTITVDSSDTGVLEITLTQITFTYSGKQFTVTLTGDNNGQGTIDNDTSKTWISYELSMTPQEATNLLPLDPEHLITVTLDSSDEDGAAPVADQTLELTLTSDNGATIVQVDDFDHRPDGVTSTTCTTDENGQCDVWISADTPGHATLSASYDIYIDLVLVDTIETSDYSSDVDGDTNGQDADKDWTSYLVDVSGPAINLVDSDHTFVVTVRQTFDGINYDYIEGAVFGQTAVLDGSYILITDNDGGTAATIDGGTCFEEPGTDELGQCTVEVSTTETTIATVTAYYLGTASDSDSDFFFDGNTKQWIDYMLDVDPDTADNLVDNPHVFTVSVAVDLGEGDGWQALPEDEMAEVALSGVGTISSTGDGGTVAEDGMSGTCVLVPNGDGTASTCQVTIDSAVAGLSELTASYEGVAADGDLVNLEETATYTDEEGPAEKNWVDYNLVLNEDAVNPIGTTHTFTATLTKATTSDEDGSIFVIAPNEELVFSIAGVGTVIDVIDGTVDADGLGGVCTTDANGQCDIVIQSDEVGTTTVTAEYFAEVGETTGTFDDEAVKTWVSNPAISLVKTGSTTEAELGELVTYTYLITNTGDVRLDFVTLDDEIDVSGLFADLLNLLLPSAGLSLEPGESVEFESSYLVTGDDFPGPIDNVAETTGTAPDGTVVRDDDDWSVTVIGDPAIELIKEANIVPDASGIKNVTVDPANAGATTIEYTYTVTNVGNVPLSNLTLTDYVLSEIPDNPIGDYSYDEALAAFDGTLITVDLPVDSLAPGATTVGVATFSVRDIDVANALINNVAEVNGTDAAGTTVSDDDPETVFVTAVLGVVIEKPPLPATGISAFELLMYGLLAGGLGLVLVYVLPSAPVTARRRDED
jgi:uncharacterized repeat protein (TIGR01451 family)